MGFLGYRASSSNNSNKGRMVNLMADYLFDVSHAMYAWEQTDLATFGLGFVSEKNCAALDNTQLMTRDQSICDTLFDDRALRKIGGFGPSSLLYHSVIIKRIRDNDQSWGEFAKSSLGKKMLTHHLNDRSRLQVGQQRRGQRIRKSRSAFYPIHSIHQDDKVKAMSRSSSFASMESEPVTKQFGSECSVNDSSSSSSSCKIMDQPNPMQVQSSMPDSLSITVSRQDVNKSWGILLAKEGSMCVVIRTPVHHQQSSTDDNACQQISLQKGYLIVSVRNEHNDVVLIPTVAAFATGGHDSGDGISTDWFSKVVGLFKKSCILHLNVTRVLRTLPTGAQND